MSLSESTQPADFVALKAIMGRLPIDKHIRRNEVTAYKASPKNVKIRNGHYHGWSLELENAPIPGGTSDGLWVTLNGPGYEQLTLRRPDQPTTISRELMTAISNCLTRKSNPGKAAKQEFGEIPGPEDVAGFTAWYRRMAMAIVT